jgi:hypothetical protein
VKKTIQVVSVKFRDFGDLGLTCSAIRSRHLSPRITPPSVFSEYVRLLAFGDVVSVCGSNRDDLREPNAFVSGDYIQQVMNETLQSAQSSDEISQEFSNLLKLIWYTMFFEVIFAVDIMNPLPNVTSRSSTKTINSTFYWLFQRVEDKFGSCELFVFLYILYVLSLTQFVFLFSEKGLLHP